MSHVLFVLCMEYLSRILAYIGNMEVFKCFKGCVHMKLTHLYFVDDLLLFSKGESMSTYILVQGLKLFSETTGLQANNTKSALCCSGMKEEETNRIQ